MASIIPRIDPAKFRADTCLDCKGNVAVGTLDDDFCIIHMGDGCDGFTKRFGVEGATTAYNEQGDQVVRHKPSKAKALSETKEDKDKK